VCRISASGRSFAATFDGATIISALLSYFHRLDQVSHYRRALDLLKSTSLAPQGVLYFERTRIKLAEILELGERTSWLTDKRLALFQTYMRAWSLGAQLANVIAAFAKSGIAHYEMNSSPISQK
jgi:hypothetical protein